MSEELYPHHINSEDELLPDPGDRQGEHRANCGCAKCYAEVHADRQGEERGNAQFHYANCGMRRSELSATQSCACLVRRTRALRAAEKKAEEWEVEAFAQEAGRIAALKKAEELEKERDQLLWRVERPDGDLDGPDLQPCDECGRASMLAWYAPNPLWNRIMGGPDAAYDPGGYLCPPCFDRKAGEQGQGLIWRADLPGEVELLEKRERRYREALERIEEHAKTTPTTISSAHGYLDVIWREAQAALAPSQEGKDE